MMSVDTFREKFHVNRISTGELDDFLTAQTYRPEVTEARNKIQSLNHAGLQSVCETPIRQGKSPKYVESEGLTCIKPKNTRDLIVELDDCDVIDAQTESEIRRQKLEYGDVVITRSGSGTIGRASIFTGGGDVYTNDHLFIVRASKADGFYVGAFLKSYWGARLLEAGISGSTGQLNLSNEHIKQIALYQPDPLVQKYIGDKIRQAERLRAWAKQVEIKVLDFHKQFIPDQSKLDFNKKTRLVTPPRMTERLDAHFYPAVVDDYINTPYLTFIPLGKISKTVFNGQTQDVAADSVAVDQITVTNLSRTYVKGEARRVCKPAGDDKLTRRHDLLVCNAAHNKSYIGRDITYCHSENPMLPSTEVMVIRVNRDELPASFVRTYLLSRLGFVQIQSTIRGITAHSYPTDMKKLDIPVPEVPAELRHEWFACDEQMASAGEACEVASKLTSAAKLLVEALIEGQLTEQHLIDAQKALDSDETSFDRDILNRLTIKGLEAGGYPLFTDLDQFYGVLARSQSLDE